MAPGPVQRDNSLEDFTLVKLEWNDDLQIWMEAHQEAIDKGDLTVFYEYWCRQKMNLR